MSIPTLYAYDASGSTDQAANYHDLSQALVSDLPADTTILYWDSVRRVITRAELAAINKARRGNGGTDPLRIAEYVREQNFHGHLVILTDGQVSTNSVDAAGRLLGNDWAFASVTVHLCHTGGTVNMSVSCPFTRASPHTVHLYEPANGYTAKTVTSVTAADLETLTLVGSLRTIPEFMAAAPALERVLIARTMGTNGDPTLRDSLLAMKRRLIAADAATKGSSPLVTQLTDALAAGDHAAALQAADGLTVEYYDDTDDVDAGTWSARFNRLLSMAEGALRGTFDLSNLSGAIRGDRARRAAAAPVAVATAVPETGGDTGGGAAPFVCPITLEAGGDTVLLIADVAEPLLGGGLDKDIVNDLVSCPLNLFKYPDLVRTLLDRLDHPISLAALKEAEDAGAPIATSPLTRRPVIAGGLCLGADAQHAAATNWTLARLVSGGRLLGNPDLWFAALWIAATGTDAPAYLRDVAEPLATHLKWRLANSTAPLSLQGLPEFPITRVPLHAALWYVVASAALNPPPARDVLRAHLPHIRPLLQVLGQTGHTLPRAFRWHIERLSVLMSMLTWVKRDRHTLPARLRALYQAAIHTDAGTWIFVDGPATPEQKRAVRTTLPALYNELPDDELVGLGALVNPQLAAADIPLRFDWTAPPLPTPTIAWAYGLTPVDRDPIRVCPATCRPYFVVPPATWAEAAEVRYSVPAASLLSVHAEYGHYVVKHGAFPTPAALLTHLWARVSGQGKTTLPHRVTEFVEDICRDYAMITATLPVEITPAIFAARFLASVKRTERQRLEAAATA